MVISIIGLISVISVISLGSKPERDKLEIAVEELVSNIRLEQAKAMAVADCANFGVERINNSSYKLICSSKIINLESGLILSGGPITFIPPEPANNIANFTINTTTISINENGSIEITP